MATDFGHVRTKSVAKIATDIRKIRDLPTGPKWVPYDSDKDSDGADGAPDPSTKSGGAAIAKARGTGYVGGRCS